MRSLYICILFLAGLLPRVVAQINANTSLEHPIIKFSPLPLFDGDNTLQFGVEVPFGKSNFSFQQDLGFGHAKYSIWYAHHTNPPNKQTFKSRSQLRYYYLNRNRFRAYVAGEVMLKHVQYKQIEWVGQECANWTCNYFMQMPVEINRKVVAVHPRLGWHWYFSQRLTLDLFFGVGLRNIKVQSDQVGTNNVRVRVDDDFWFPQTSSETLIPSIALGFHLGIVLGKFPKVEE